MDWTDNILLYAFIMGLVAACSLPLGTLTTLIWKPGDRAVGVLMAFGGGALLAALTIDLVGSALSKGHFNALAIGCIIGGFLFVALDRLVNNQGGFLRKSSTVVQYLRRKRRERFKKALEELERIDIFQDLSSEDIEDLASAVTLEKFDKGATLYSMGDPSEFLYIVETGQVTQTEAKAGEIRDRALGPGACFGRLAFVTGSPHGRNAHATEACEVWMLPRDDFESVLETSAAVAGAVSAMVTSEAAAEYLRDRHRMAEDNIEQWQTAAAASLAGGGVIPTAIAIERKRDEFVRVSDGIRRIPFFQGLPATEINAIADRLFCVEYERGDTIFHRSEPADRMYIVVTGEVALLDPTDPLSRRMTIDDGEAFGGRSFLTAARHAVSAIATDDCELWVLRKSDFDVLLRRFPELHTRVKNYLEDAELSEYLQNKQGIDQERIARWLQHATRNVDSGRLIPSVADMAEHMGQHGGAPIAIWLGIMLDGIPESLVIGSSAINSNVSLSLIAGLFLSNYPEALSSSVGMRQQGMSFARVLVMWSSLTLITGIGAALGSIFFVGADPHAFAIVEGIAAGAMLTMIAQTMAPEAYIKGGSVVGISTLFGFLAAIFFKTLE